MQPTYEYNVSLLAVSNFQVPVKCASVILALVGGSIVTCECWVDAKTVADFPYAVANDFFSLILHFLAALAP